MEKVCTHCKLSKPFSEYSPLAKGRFGLYPRCKACVRARVNEKRLADPVAHAAKSRAWRAANVIRAREIVAVSAERNADKIKAQRSARYWADPESARTRNNAYRAANAPAVRKWDRTRQAAKQQAVPAWADHGKIQAAYDAADLLMQITGEWYEVDHIVPLQGKIKKQQIVCGLHVEYNLQVIPRSENRRKSYTQWPDMPGKGN